MTHDLHPERTGGCACGAVRFKASGPPDRCGLCHCRTCQKTNGAAYYPFVVYHRRQVTLSGETSAWDSSPDYRRLFCTICGGHAADLAGDEIELAIGSFDDPAGLAPQYESWTIRRLPWVAPLPVPQFERDRPA